VATPHRQSIRWCDAAPRLFPLSGPDPQIVQRENRQGAHECFEKEAYSSKCPFKIVGRVAPGWAIALCRTIYAVKERSFWDNSCWRDRQEQRLPSAVALL